MGKIDEVKNRHSWLWQKPNPGQRQCQKCGVIKSIKHCKIPPCQLFEHQCEEMFCGAGDLHGHPSWRCLNMATIQRGGKWYCTEHSGERIPLYEPKLNEGFLTDEEMSKAFEEARLSPFANPYQDSDKDLTEILGSFLVGNIRTVEDAVLAIKQAGYKSQEEIDAERNGAWV